MLEIPELIISKKRFHLYKDCLECAHREKLINIDIQVSGIATYCPVKKRSWNYEFPSPKKCHYFL
ncbi:MAG: hypothetical protein GY870_18740 [archaeon]|nr:hypothetical protein [archaeon]